MFFNENKNIALCNNASLDTYHDIVVSFDYARYNRVITPTGGFAVVFYNSNFEKPQEGGPGFALGYLPSGFTDYCKLNGYGGLNGAFLAVGFDLNGAFALPGGEFDGIQSTVPNSCTIRGGIEDNFKYISTSKNILNTAANVKIAEQLNENEDPEFLTIKIIISKGFQNIKVQIKKEEEKSFITILDTTIPLKEKDAVRVAITSTVDDDNTMFEVKNFNVVGFPGAPREPKFTDCLQTIELNGFSQGNTIVTEENFVAVPANGGIDIYKLKNSKFVLNQTISESTDIKLIGGSSKFLIAATTDTPRAIIYYNNNDQFFRSQEIDMLVDSSGAEEGYIFDKPAITADTDDSTLVFGNGTQLTIYQYIFNPGASGFGVFVHTGQTIVDEISGGLGVSVQVEKEKLLAGSSKGFVSFYTNNGFEFLPTSTIVDPVTGNPYSKFGGSLSLSRNDLIIGSPQAFKDRYKTVGQGEAYHYYFSFNRLTNTREWRRIMNLGNFFLVDTPGGEFGYSVFLKGNNLVVSAPFENYLNPPDQVFENIPNCGRIYFFEKTTSGIFTRGVTVFPSADKALPYSFFGKYVGFLGNNIGLGVTPYTPGSRRSELNIFNTECVYDTPPRHLPITEQSIALVDNAGYAIDMETLTYMQLICASSAYGKQ